MTPTDFLIFALFPFVFIARNGVSMLKTAGLRIVADGLGALVPTLGHLAGSTTDLGFFPSICKTWYDPMLAYDECHHG